jgi:hypothetical protein
MKHQYIVVSLFGFLVMLVMGCSSSPSNPSGGSDNVTSTDLDGIYVFDESETDWRYLYVPRSAMILYRSRIQKTYPFTDLRRDANCFIRVETTVHDRVAYKVMRMHDQPNMWLTASMTYSPSGQEEPYVSIDEESLTPTSTRNFWRIHTFGKRDGMAVVAIESVEFPGHYFESMGHTFSGNGVRLVAHDAPEKAQKLFVHSLPTGPSIID